MLEGAEAPLATSVDALAPDFANLEANATIELAETAAAQPEPEEG